MGLEGQLDRDWWAAGQGAPGNIENMDHDLRGDFKTSHKDKMKVILLRSIRGPFGSED